MACATVDGPNAPLVLDLRTCEATEVAALYERAIERRRRRPPTLLDWLATAMADDTSTLLDLVHPFSWSDAAGALAAAVAMAAAVATAAAAAAVVATVLQYRRLDGCGKKH